jgi:hypothetical protein
MSTQRRVTAPPKNKAEVVTDSLRPVSLETPPHKESRWIPPHGSRTFAQGLLADLVLPAFPGVG